MSLVTAKLPLSPGHLIWALLSFQERGLTLFYNLPLKLSRLHLISNLNSRKSPVQMESLVREEERASQQLSLPRRPGGNRRALSALLSPDAVKCSRCCSVC